MKKVILVFLLIILTMFISSKNDMIRIRVLANSNSEYDQKVKMQIVDIVKKEFKSILKDTNDIDDARDKINANLNELSNKVDSFLADNNIEYKSKINFGLNYFPAKEYKGKIFEDGYYESVLVTLGQGSGDNWWCILFPTVCLNDSNVKYESLIKKIYTKILG